MARMTFQFLDVGQGDGTLVQMRSTNQSYDELALIDFGEKRAPFKVAYHDAMTYLVKTITENSANRPGGKGPYVDVLFLTHPDGDHYNKIPDLINAFGGNLKFGRVVFGGNIGNYGSLITDMWAQGKVEKKPKPLASNAFAVTTMDEDVIPTWEFAGGAVKVYLLSANYPSIGASKTNPKSIVLMFECGPYKVTTQGDAEADVEAEIMTNFEAAFLESVGMKLGHHGSKKASSYKWINTVKPKAIFATGDMVWAHPYCEVICRFIKANVLPNNYTGFPVVWYCCGAGHAGNREYFNNSTTKAIGLNLWYVAKGVQENLLWGDAETPITVDQGWTLGVQWAFRVGDTGSPPGFLLTERAVPTPAQQQTAPFDCATVPAESEEIAALLAARGSPELVMAS
jgi:competence protein ComEC